MADIDRDTARALAGICRDCPEPALEGGLGAKCLAREAAGRKRQRQERADAGVCIEAGCGRRVEKVLRHDGSAVLRRCAGCAERKHKGRRDIRRGVTGGAAGVMGKSADPALKKWKTESAYIGGYSTTRYAGRGRHGGVTREEKDDELRIHLRDAVARIQHVEQRGLARLRLEERELGTHSMKREARILAADPLGVAVRLAALGWAEIHPDGWSVVKEWARSLLDDDDAEE